MVDWEPASTKYEEIHGSYRGVTRASKNAPGNKNVITSVDIGTAAARYASIANTSINTRKQCPCTSTNQLTQGWRIFTVTSVDGYRTSLP